MFSRGAFQPSPEMPKRAMLAGQSSEGSACSQKKFRHPPADSSTGLGKTKNHAYTQKLSQRQNRHNQNGSSRRQHPCVQNGSSKKSSLDLKGESLGSSDDEQSSTKESSESCVTDDSAVVSIKPEVSKVAPHDDSASSSPAAINHEPKIATLGSKDAGLRISSDCSSNSSFGHEVMSLPTEEFPEESQRLASALPAELVHDILGRLPWRSVVQFQSQMGRGFRDLTRHPAFLRSRPSSEAALSPSFFTTDAAGDLHWLGFDTKSREWASLPSLNFAKNRGLPSPDPDLFKDYLVAGDGGLLCINVGKSTGREELVVCNPLTRQVKLLPPLKHSRHPVLMHLRVDDDSKHYKIVVAGSAAIGTEDLSLKTEEYDSRRGEWECPENSDMPCPQFGLNEYQNGVYFTDSDRELLLCVAIIDTGGRGVLVYDLKMKQWVRGLTRYHIPLVRNEPNVGYLATTQIVECGGSVFVFSEQECGREVYFLIHKLNLDVSEDQPWDEILRRKRAGGRGLLVYPEFTCVAVSEHELCIFNSVEHTMEIIDLNKPTEVALLLPAPSSKANRFHSLNPIGFVYRPSFKNVACPRGLDPEFRCNNDKSEYCSECDRRDSESGRQKKVGPNVMNFPAAAEPKAGAAPSNETHSSPDLDESEKASKFPPKHKGTRRRKKR